MISSFHAQDAKILIRYLTILARNSHGLAAADFEAIATRVQRKRIRIQKARDKIDLVKSLEKFRGVDGRVNLFVRTMDCDCCQSDYVRQIEGTPEAYEAFCEDLYAGAEGTTSIMIVSAEYAAEIVPTTRDLIMEAFEDGHPHSVHV